jgi:hypothetical protein
MRWHRNPYKDEYFDKIESLGRKNRRPFNSWLGGQERVYFPFDPEHVLGFSSDDEDVIEVLEEADFEVHDYKGGYCRREGSNRPVRIGKVLNRLRKKELQELKEKHKLGEIYNLRRAMRSLNKSHDALLNNFSSSSYRDAINIAKFSVVISQNPHDIAKMSTGRAWESCMTLGTGSMQGSVFKEVKSGGLIAYLIHADDLDIKKPLSRIHIRRFEGLPGRGATGSIAKAEASVYGENVEGFKKAVNEWINEHQGKVPGGVYKLAGGSYSDTFSHNLQIGGSWDLPKEPNALLEVYYGRGLEDIPYMTWEVISNIPWRTDDDDDDEDGGDNLIFLSESDAQDYVWNHFLSQYGDWRKDDDQYHLEETGEAFWTLEDEDGEYVNEPFSIEEKLVDKRPELQSQAAVKIANAEKGIFSPKIILEIKNKYPTLHNTLIIKYPELYTKDELEGMGKYDLIKFIKALPEEEREPHIQQTVNQFEELVEDPASYLPPCLVCMKPINPEIEPAFKCSIVPILHHSSCPEVCEIMQEADKKKYGDNSKQHGTYEWAYTKLDDIIDIYMEFRTRPYVDQAMPIPENLIQKLITIPERTYLTGKIAMRFRAHLLHVLSMTRSDTPTVQDFFESLLPYWKYEFRALTDKERRRPSYMRANKIIDMSNLGSAIAWLGENGRRFLPFIKSRLEQIRADFGPQAFDPNDETIPEDFHPADALTRRSKVDAWEFILRITERYLYILDSIESGLGRSNKYRFGNW